MWKFSLLCNVLITTLLWLISLVLITLTNDVLSQYIATGAGLSRLTEVALRVRDLMVIIPLTWAFLSIMYGIRIGSLAQTERNQSVQAHMAISLVLGLSLLLFVVLASSLPFLHCCAEID